MEENSSSSPRKRQLALNFETSLIDYAATVLLYEATLDYEFEKAQRPAHWTKNIFQLFQHRVNSNIK